MKENEQATDEFKIGEEGFAGAVEAVLFASGDPMQIDKLSDITGISRDILADKMEELIEDYKRNKNRGIYIRRIEDAYTLSTKPDMKDVLQRMFLPRNRPPMSQAAYETLAIVAYNQPVTRAQVEAVRGVGSDSIISRLVEKDLVHECGTLDAPGRPMLFETTQTFLKEFGFSSIHDLPPMDMLMYKTLRDIEDSVAKSASIKKDSQITIQQLVEAVKPVNKNEEESPEENEDKTDYKPVDDEEMMNISKALFGSEE